MNHVIYWINSYIRNDSLIQIKFYRQLGWHKNSLK